MAYHIRSEKRVKTVVKSKLSPVPPPVVLADLAMLASHDLPVEPPTEDFEVDETFITETDLGWEVLCTPLAILDMDYKYADITTRYSKSDMGLDIAKRMEGFSIPWRLYETAGGYRLILATLDHAPDSDFINSLPVHDLVDTRYTAIGKAQGLYRARLTPKPERVYVNARKQPIVCFLVCDHCWQDVVDQEILDIVAEHDQCATFAGSPCYYLA